MAEPTITSDIDLSLENVEAWEAPEIEIDDGAISEESLRADKALGGIEDSISQLQAANQSRLRGEISGDVAEQLRAQSAETAMAGGISTDSPAARSLQARDFGLTSLQIQDAGIQTQKDIAGLQTNLAKLSEARYQFQESMAQKQKEFREQSRQFGASLEQDALRTQIASQELRARQNMFNKEQNLKLYDMMAELATQQAAMQVSAATSDQDFDMDPVNTIFNDMISIIDSAMAGSEQ